jgi:diaminopimelate epimerase
MTAQTVLQGPPDVLPELAVAWPAGNTTAIVYGDELLSVDRKRLNEIVMDWWKDTCPGQPAIEQCCFLTPAANSEAIARVEMFGGEFCGNAARSAAWLVTGGQDYSGVIEVSGADRLLRVGIKNGEVTAEMPLPANEAPSVVEEGTLVQLEGIAQLVVTDDDLRGVMTSRQLLESLIAANKYDLASQSAVGVSYYDSKTCRAAFCVWVRKVGTVFDETACGSGSCAIGVAAAMTAKGAVRLPVIQPSGEIIYTNADYDSERSRAGRSAISGEVRILYDGGFITHAVTGTAQGLARAGHPRALRRGRPDRAAVV